MTRPHIHAPRKTATRLATTLGVPDTLLSDLHDLHVRQWKLEDAARQHAGPPVVVATVKTAIDASNTRRHRIIDAIDAACCLKPAGHDARLYSETIGELCDRLLIVDIKLAALTGRQAHPPSGAVAGLRNLCAHLSALVTQLLEDLAAGRALLPPRVGIKVYRTSRPETEPSGGSCRRSNQPAERGEIA